MTPILTTAPRRSILEPASIGRFDAFGGHPAVVARRLLGQRLVRLVDGKRMAGIIVETEAYLGSKDRAAHTFNGRKTARNASMYLPGGHAYVYFTYGMHYCFNVVCGSSGEGVAVLIRAIQPTEGIDLMQARRPAARHDFDLCRGPARLTQALAIDRKLDGEKLLTSAALFIERIRRRALPSARIAATAHIGVEYAGPWSRRLLRFFVRGNRYVSAQGDFQRS